MPVKGMSIVAPCPPNLRNLLDIELEGGLPLRNGDRLVPNVVLAGRDASKLETLSKASGGARRSTDLDSALADRPFARRGDGSGASRHGRRGKTRGHPGQSASAGPDEASDAARCRLLWPHPVGEAGLRLVGVRRVLPAVAAIELELPVGPGGGLVLDMYAHFRYILDRVVAPVTSIVCRSAIQTPRRADERGNAYDVDTDDAAYALMELDGGIIATVTSSWATRLRRDDMLQLQIDSTHGSAVAGLHDGRTQALVNTPKPPWNADSKQPMNFYTQWQDVPENIAYRPSFRACWEDFLRHVAEDAPFVPTLLEGAKAVQRAEIAYHSNTERRWVDVPPLLT